MHVYEIYIDYLIILINNIQIVTFLYCIPTILRKWWAGEGGTYLKGVRPLRVGAYLGEGAYKRVGALFEEIWYVIVFVW